MAQSPRVEDKRVVGTADCDLADVRERVSKRGADVVEKSPRRGNEIALPREAEAVERKDLEMARQRFGRCVERESPAVVIRLGKRLSGAVSFKRLVKFLLRLELLYHELASREVEKRETEPMDCGGVVVHRLVEKPVFSDGARGDDARDFAADEPLRKLRVLDLVAERGSLPGPDELREIAVERVVGNAAHRLVPAMRQRRAENWRGDNSILAEHLVEVAEAKHEYRPRWHLAFQREVLPLHRCKLVGHREAKTRT